METLASRPTLFGCWFWVLRDADGATHSIGAGLGSSETLTAQRNFLVQFFWSFETFEDKRQSPWCWPLGGEWCQRVAIFPACIENISTCFYRGGFWCWFFGRLVIGVFCWGAMIDEHLDFPCLGWFAALF